MYVKRMKRALDVFLSIIAFPFFLLACLLIAPAIKRSDGGPVFYCGQRVGKQGKIFKMYKFRTMIHNAPDLRMPNGATYNGKDDPRLTKIGRFLREYSLDEIPQVLNIIRGEMSVVGPRPDTPAWLPNYPGGAETFMSMKPGITGYNQAYFRNDSDPFEKMKWDEYYMKNCTFWMDVKIIFKTFSTVLQRKNVYRSEEDKQGDSAE